MRKQIIALTLALIAFLSSFTTASAFWKEGYDPSFWDWIMAIGFLPSIFVYFYWMLLREPNLPDIIRMRLGYPPLRTRGSNGRSSNGSSICDGSTSGAVSASFHSSCSSDSSSSCHS